MQQDLPHNLIERNTNNTENTKEKAENNTYCRTYCRTYYYPTVSAVPYSIKFYRVLYVLRCTVVIEVSRETPLL